MSRRVSVDKERLARRVSSPDWHSGISGGQDCGGFSGITSGQDCGGLRGFIGSVP